MNHSGDAAEQIVRMSLEGVEVAARITGTAAKELAVLLVAALRSKNSTLKPKGKARLTSMLKSGKPLEVFSVKDSDLQKFVQGAKQYGIVYCVLRNKNAKDGLCDILVKAEDSPKISRLVERFKFATVDKAKIESEITAARAEKAAGAEPDAPDIDETDKLIDDFLVQSDGKATPDKVPEAVQAEQKTPKSQPIQINNKDAPANPRTATTDAPHPSAPISESRANAAGGILSKPSVKGEIREITAAKKAKEAEALEGGARVPEDMPNVKPTTTTHKQPPRRKSKSKKSKGSR